MVMMVRLDVGAPQAASSKPFSYQRAGAAPCLQPKALTHSLSLSLYRYTYVCISIYLYIYLSLSLSLYIYIYIYIYLFIHTPGDAAPHVALGVRRRQAEVPRRGRLCICVYIYIYIHNYIHNYVCIYIYIYIYIYICTHV